MKKRIKLLSAVLLIAFIAVMLTACTADFDRYDDEQFLAGNVMSFTQFNSRKNTISGTTTWEVELFGGMKIITKSLQLEENATIDMQLEFTSGKFKLIAVKDSVVYTLIENESCTEIKTSLVAGTYSIRAVGDNAQFCLKWKS